MKFRSSLIVAFLSLAVLGVQTVARADEERPAGVRGEILVWLDDARDKLVELADAVPASKYSWRPAKGVRSPGEVFIHVDAANYGLPSFLGVKTPEGFDFMTFEKSLTKKEDIQKALKNSFEHAEKALREASDADMDKPAEFFGMKTTVRGGYLLVLAHAHEHLGQSIAYARVNGITPPWTAKQMAEQKEAAEKKAKEAEKSATAK